jgi:hypothetical protein
MKRPNNGGQSAKLISLPGVLIHAQVRVTSTRMAKETDFKELSAQAVDAKPLASPVALSIREQFA